MERLICAIYDKVAEELFGPVLMVPNASVAIRTFQDGLFSQNSPMTSHPEDFDLYELGTIDSGTGKITPHPRAFLGTAIVTGAAIVAARGGGNGAG